MIRRISLIYPGAMFSVRDVARGYHHALADIGIEVRTVDMPKRLTFMEKALEAVAGVSDENVTYRQASDLATAEVLRQNPDLVLVVSSHYLHVDTYVLLRRAGFRIAVVLTECPYQDEGQMLLAELSDWVFVNDRNSVDRFRAKNQRTWYLPPAYEPAVHRAVAPDPAKASDVFFVATGFKERLEFLEAIDWTGIDFVLRGLWPMGDDSPVRQYWKDELIPNEEVPGWYASTKIALNFHRTSRGFGYNMEGDIVLGEAYSVNPRTYELAACRTFQLCDDTRPELRALFGDSIPTFRDAQDLEAMIRYYLAHPAERARCAEEAYWRVHPHTFRNRARDLVERIVRADQAVAVPA